MFGNNSEPSKELLLLMQEPILTRWKTCGTAACYIDCYFALLKSLCQSIRKSKAYQGSSKIGQAASNFLSLAKERERLLLILLSMLISILFILNLILISTGSLIKILVLLVSFHIITLCVTFSKSKI